MKVVIWVHQADAGLHRSLRLMLTVLQLRGRDVSLVGLCDCHIEALSEQLSLPIDLRTAAIPNSAVYKTQASPPRTTRDEGSPVVGMLANLSIEKGVGVFIEVASRRPDLQFELSGPPADLPTKRLIQDAGVSVKNLKYRGRLDPAERREFLDKVDVFLFPSAYKFETQPLVILEAASAGCLIAASDIGCIREMLRGNGLTIPIADQKSAEVWVAAIDELLAGETKSDPIIVEDENRWVELLGLPNASASL